VAVIDRGSLKAMGTPDDLSRRLWQGLWVEIDLRVEASRAMMDAVQGLACVRSVETADGILTVELRDEGDIPGVVEGVVAAGGRIYGVAQREHTLEEIYFQIQGEGVSEPEVALGP
jgi:hypothetical protein